MRQKLLDEIMSLDSDEKLELVKLLLRDPLLDKYAYDPLGLRSNFEAARILREILEEKKAAGEPSIQ